MKEPILVRIFVIVLCLLPLAAKGQYLPLLNTTDGGALSLNIDRVWRYNLYEGSRWGAGLQWQQALGERHRLTADGFVGYGLRDQKTKWGLRVEVDHFRKSQPHEPMLVRRDKRTVRLEIAYDLRPAASRIMEEQSLRHIDNYTTIMTSRMSHVERTELQLRWVRQKWSLSTGLRVSFEQRLYDGAGLRYPDSYYSTRRTTLYNYTEWLLGFATAGLTVNATAGATNDNYACTPDLYLRLLAQYAHRHILGPLYADTYVQTGWCDGTDHDVPYSRMFDLGGTAGAPYYFSRTLLSAKPNEFTSNLFVFASLSIGADKPLFDVWNKLLSIGSHPRPFAGVNAAWGKLWRQDSEGWRTTQGLRLQAPHHGVAEVNVGIDGLLHWGLTDWGVAAACRLWPEIGKPVWLFTASLAL